MTVPFEAPPLSLTSPLQAEKLCVSYGRRPVLSELDIAFPREQVTAIVGPNGCGKSTLLSALARLHTPQAGRITLERRDIRSYGARELARALALLPQNVTAPEGLTAAELIRFGRQPHQSWLRQWSAEDAAVVDAALAAADLQALAHRPLEAMSGGQRQRAWIAMAIAQQTPVLLLDEPTTALDLGHAIEVFELVRDLAAEGKTVVMVLHDLGNACRYADHLVAMRDGRVVAAGPPSEIVSRELVRELYGVDCTLVTDTDTGAPLLANVRRARDIAAPGSSIS
ncbi:Iron dicitrate transport system permease protein FecE [Salinisphaera shabanensis E1L3A]|uniref:Iron dicitrate transport system permease protein FecE n=1 Tax=Salinisphaera shabanensis E1L3A TaxID=1033802 RepID=U2EQY0_9GAMM|nr:ABC transporter ATP-binding protein [Salinisphaera shabanensis]ERJ20452.1 Iron dicitrate transport system permease protein FecE [Salinisphaera shabanensis E1L3A]